jgi:acetyl esterase/lipase
MSYKFQSEYLDTEITGGRVFDVFMPDAVTQDISIFIVHGGGWQGGSRGGYHNIMRAFNKHGFICASTDYRLMGPGGGVNIFDQITDIRHAYDSFLCFLAGNKRPKKIFTHGSSAGAHLAALLSFAKPGECGESLEYKDYKYKTAWVSPVGTALQATPLRFEPWEDIFPHIWTDMQRIVGAPYDKAPEHYSKVAPINYISHDTCPVFFMHAEDEHMFPLDQTVEFAEKMKSLGRRAEYKVYTRAEHGFFYDVTRRQQKEAFADILSFIRGL